MILRVNMSRSNSAVLDVSENKQISCFTSQSVGNEGSNMSNTTTYENLLVNSPSIESFSKIHDIENLSELNMEENSDLCVKIDSPQKHLDTLETYITFRVITKVARIEFLESEYTVRRRYNDFLWLREKLIDCHSFCIVPPLPRKHSLAGQLDRYSKDFIVKRMKALNIFVSRIIRHPILSCNEHFKLFLTANQTDFNLHMRQRSLSDKSKPLQFGLTTYSNLKIRHLEFDTIKSYLTVLANKLLSIEKISNRINKERQHLVSELYYFYPSFATWAASESDSSKILQNIANALEKNAFAQNKIISNYSNIIANPIQEFVTYIEVIQETLQKREAYQSIYEQSVEELSKKKMEKDKVMSASQKSLQSSGFLLWRQPSCNEKLEKLGSFIPHLVKKVEVNQDNLECANEQLRSDLEQWRMEKEIIIKNILLDFVNNQIEFYENSVSAWEYVTNKTKHISAE